MNEKQRPALDELPGRLIRLRQRLRRAEQQANRAPGEVSILAVSKRHPAEAVRVVAATGQRAFGENYLSEAVDKMAVLEDLDLEWHYIGPIQSNKTRGIAEHFDWVHSIDREKIARRLSDQRPESLGELNALIQVHIGDEESKSGIEPERAASLAAFIGDLPMLRLRGLMCIPPPSDDYDTQRGYFRTLRELFDELNEDDAMDTLSMGMSADLEAAVAEGATIVRIGTDIFGPRDP